MIDTRWTPGPWCVDDPNEHLVAEDVNGVYEYIANCDPAAFSATKRVDSEINSNAHLIAAAPKLYEALWDLYAQTHKGDDGYLCVHCRMSEAEYRHIESILAKARGQS